MLTTDDKKEIRKIVREEVRTEVENRTDPLRALLVEIEKDRKILSDIWEFVKEHTRRIDHYEDRINVLESGSSKI